MKKYLLLFSSVFALSLVSCGSSEDAPIVLPELEFNLAGHIGKQEIHTEEQKNWFLDKDIDEIKNRDSSELTDMNGMIDYTIPKPINLSWTCSGGFPFQYKVEVSEKEDMSDAFTIYSKETSVDFYNAKINQTYYWRVSAFNSVSEVSSFVTIDKGPRFINIDGVHNVRDIGDGKILKQGMVYRGGSFEESGGRNQPIVIKVTDEGKATIKNQLKIKTEIDLRMDKSENQIVENCGLTESTVEGVNYYALPMMYRGENVLTFKNNRYDDPLQFKRFFEIASDVNNYPFYIHCSEGKDRTGGICYVLEALWNEDLGNEYLIRDYIYSTLAKKGYNMKYETIESKFVQTLNEYLLEEHPEYSLSERTYLYLLDVIGVPASQLDSVIRILGTGAH